jgi:hypothetical protein
MIETDRVRGMAGEWENGMGTAKLYQNPNKHKFMFYFALINLWLVFDYICYIWINLCVITEP